MPKNYGINDSQDCLVSGGGGGEVLVVGLAVSANNGNLASLSGSVFSNCGAGGLQTTFTMSVGGVQIYQGPPTVDEIITIPSGTYQGVEVRITANAANLFSPTITVVNGFDGIMEMSVTLSASDNCNSDAKTVNVSFEFQEPTAVFTINELAENVFEFNASGSLDNGCPGTDAYLWTFPGLVESVDYNYISGYGPTNAITRIDVSNYAASNPGASFTINLDYTTACGSNQATATSDTSGGGGSCDDVIYPDISQFVADVEASTNGTNTTFTWLNIKNTGGLPAPVISVSNVTATSAFVDWPDLGGVQSYSVRYREVGGSTWTQIDSIAISQQTLSGLMGNSNYEVQAQAVYSSGTSAWSNLETFQTQQQTTSTSGIMMGANQFLNTPLNVLTSNDGAVPLGLMRIYANTINTTSGATHSSDPYNPAFNPADGFSGMNITGYLESLAAAGHGIVYVNEGAPWTTPDTASSNRSGTVYHGLPANDPNAIYTNGDLSLDKSQYRQLTQLCAIQAIMWGPSSGDIHGLTGKTGLLANVRGNIVINQDVFRNGGGIQWYNEGWEHWEGNDFTYTLPAQLVSDLGLNTTETRKGGDLPPEISAAITHAVSSAVAAVNTEVKVYGQSDVFFDPAQFARWKWYWDTFNGGVVPNNVQYALHHYQHYGAMNNTNYKQLIDFGNRPLAPDQGGSSYDDMEDLMRTAVSLCSQVNIPPERIGLYEIGPDVDDRNWNGSLDGGPNVVDAIGSMDKQDVQSSWLLRSAVHFFRSGMTEFVMYAIRDANEATSAGNRQGWLFDTSGLCYGNYQKTKTWFDYFLMARWVQGSTYDQQITNNNGDNTVQIDRFEDSANNRAIYTIYKNTVSDAQSSNITFALQAGESSPVNYKRNGSSDQGVSSTPTLSGQNVAIATVDEHVQYVVVSTN